VWGICSPTYAKISPYPAACGGDSLLLLGFISKEENKIPCGIIAGINKFEETDSLEYVSPKKRRGKTNKGEPARLLWV
jgi:hypothetical protein